MVDLSFRAVATTGALVCFALVAAWLFASPLLLEIWGVGHTSEAAVMARRGAALFLAFGIILFIIRNAAPSLERRAVTIGFATGCAALAALGLFELASGRAGAGILSAVVVELILAAAFVSTLRQERLT